MENVISSAFREIFSSSKATAAFCSAWIFFFAVMFFIPVYTIPGNDIMFHARVVLGYDDYLALAILSFLSAAVLVMHILIFKTAPSKRDVAASSGVAGTLGLLSGLASAILGSGTCAICIGGILSFLGSGTLIFLAKERMPLFLLAGVLLLLSFYFSAQRLVHACKACRAQDSSWQE